jgi:polyisoprenoid-binding protein YceI
VALLPALLALKGGANLDLQPESRLWVSGSSTVRSFECKATSFDARIESDGPDAAAAVLAGQKAVRTVEVTVASDRIDCNNGTMNGHMKKAIKVTEFPNITFRLDSYDLAKASDTLQAELQGVLTLGGVEKPVSMQAAVAPADGGAMRVTGTYELNMKEFGLKPPTLMLGTMRVHERVKVSFDLLLKN